MTPAAAATRQWFHEPRIINAVQCVCYFLAGAAGYMAAIGAVPTLVTAQIGPILSVVVGTTLMVGGAAGVAAVLAGHWWAERIALLIVGLGWVLLIVPTLYYAFSGARSSTVWLIVALEVTAIGDNIKRYRRIDWAYLDPAK